MGNKWPFIDGQEKHKRFIDDLTDKIVNSNIDDFNYHVLAIDQDTINCGLFYVFDEFYNVNVSIDLTSIDKWDVGFYDRNVNYFSDIFIERIKINKSLNTVN